MKMEMILSVDERWVFSEKTNRGQAFFALHQNATSCSCNCWKAYELQSTHFLLLHRGFCLNLCSSRWHQSSGLRSSLGEDEDGHKSTSVSTVGVDNLNAASDANVLDPRGVDDDASNGARHIGFVDIVNVANDLAQSVANLCNQTQKNHFFSEKIRLVEIFKRHLDEVEGV
jgi:hypothetical protein